MVCDKVVCVNERWCVTKFCVMEEAEEAEEEDPAAEAAG